MRIDTHTPHLDPDWVEAFLLELRLRDVQGHRIGAALAEAEAHCAESGESAHTVFGDPTAYAAELAPALATVAQDTGREFGASAVGVAGMLLTLAAIAAWQTGNHVELTAGMAAVLAFVLIGTAVMARRADQVLRAVAHHWWIAAVGATVPIGVCVALLLLGHQVLATAPALPVFVAGLVLLATNTVWSLLTLHVDDPVVGPDGAGGAGTLSDDAAMAVLRRVGPWLFPIITGVIALPLLLL